MKATQLEQGLFQSSVFKLTQELGDRGGEIVTRMNNDETYLKRIASYMIAGAPEFTSKRGPEPILTLDLVRGIMGTDRVIGPDVVQRVLGVTIDTQELDNANIIPYTGETLARYCKTHLLVYGFPMSVDKFVPRTPLGFRWRGLPQDNVGVMLSSIPVKGWFLISREVQDIDLLDGERLATVAELMFSLGLYKTIHKRHYLFSKIHEREYGLCTETAAGGEAYFGLGMSFLGVRYGEGSHDYWVVKEPQFKPQHTIRVVPPDKVIGNKIIIDIAKDRLADIRMMVTDFNNCPSRHIQHQIDWIKEQVREKKMTLDEAGTTAEELEQISESAFNAKEGN